MKKIFHFLSKMMLNLILGLVYFIGLGMIYPAYKFRFFFRKIFAKSKKINQNFNYFAEIENYYHQS